MMSVWLTRLESPAKRVPRLLYAGIATIMVVFLITYILHKTTGQVPLSVLTLLHINTELSIPAWYNSILLLLGAVLATFGLFTARAGERRGWVMLMVLLTYLSADEMASIHEQFGRLARIVPALDIGSFPWVVPGIVIATLGLIVAVYFGRSLPTGLPPKLLAAGVVYGAGALGVEIITGFVKNAYPDSFMIYQVLQTGLQILEEGLEMIACVMVIAALLWVFERDDDRLPRLAKHLGQ